MPRLTPLERDEAPKEARRYYDADVERYGAVLNNTKLYAHNVPVLRAMHARRLRTYKSLGFARRHEDLVALAACG